jgi:hypothetical protein
MKTNTHFRSYLAQLFLEWEMLQTKILEKLETHVLCSVTCILENRAVYEIMWKNVVERVRPQMTIWRMRIACWIPKATNTHTGCVILNCFSTATVVVRTRSNVTLLLYINYLYILLYINIYHIYKYILYIYIYVYKYKNIRILPLLFCTVRD